MLNKEFFYTLGFLWADGYLTPKYNSIVLEINKTDADEVYPVFLKTAYKWKRYERKIDNRTDCKRAPKSFIFIANKEFKDKLVKLSYRNRYKGFKEIINYVPKKHFAHFLRGLFDGDGCFYFNKSANLCQLHISGTIFQNWKELVDSISIRMGVNFNVIKRNQQRKNGKISKSSKMQISQRAQCFDFLYFIYNTFSKDKIGLQRKYDKYLIFKKDFIK